MSFSNINFRETGITISDYLIYACNICDSACLKSKQQSYRNIWLKNYDFFHTSLSSSYASCDRLELQLHISQFTEKKEKLINFNIININNRLELQVHISIRRNNFEKLVENELLRLKPNSVVFPHPLFLYYHPKKSDTPATQNFNRIQVPSHKCVIILQFNLNSFSICCFSFRFKYNLSEIISISDFFLKQSGNSFARKEDYDNSCSLMARSKATEIKVSWHWRNPRWYFFKYNLRKIMKTIILVWNFILRFKLS